MFWTALFTKRLPHHKDRSRADAKQKAAVEWKKNDAEFYDFLGYRPQSIPNPTSRIKCLHKSPSLLIFGDRQGTKRTTKPLTVVHAHIHT